MAQNSSWNEINDPYFLTDNINDEPQTAEEEEPEQPKQVARLFDPRWYHADANRASESPKEADFGDEVILEIKTEGIVDGAGIDFVVQDTKSENAFMTKRTVRARVKTGLLQAKWKIERNKNDAEVPQYSFSATYDGCSGKAGTSVTPINFIKSDGTEISDTAMIFAAPGFNKGEGGWFVVEDADIDSVLNEVTELDTLSVEIKQFRDSFKTCTISEETTKKAQELEKKVTEKFDGLIKDPSDAIEELLVVKSNKRWGNTKKRVYVRPNKVRDGKVKGAFFKNAHAKVEKAIKKWLKDVKDGSDKDMDGKLKAMWESEKIDKTWIWPWKWKIKKQEASNSADTAAGYFEVSSEAQFFRFVAGVNAGAEFDLKEMKVELGASGSMSYSLAEGTVTGTWNLPDEDGFDLFHYLNLAPKVKEIIKKDRKCRLRITTKAEGKAFAGASIAASISLPCIDLSKNDKRDTKKEQSVSASASGKGFAGVSLDGKIASTVEWLAPVKTEFNAVAEIGATGGLSGGVGAEVKFEIEYKNDKFRFEAGAMAVFGLGGQGGCAFELNVDEGLELLGYIFSSVNFHKIDTIGSLAFKTYVNVAFAQFTVPGKVGIKLVESASSWLAKQKRMPTGFQEAKQVIRTNLDDIQKLRNSPPEALGELLQTITEFPTEDDFDAILKVLQSAEGLGDEAHKLKWILRCFHDPDLSENTKGKDLKTAEMMKKKALDEGIGELLEFGEGMKGKDNYYDNLSIILQRNGIIYDK